MMEEKLPSTILVNEELHGSDVTQPMLPLISSRGHVRDKYLMVKRL